MKSNEKRLKQMGLNHKRLRESIDPIKYGYIKQSDLSDRIEKKTGMKISGARISNFETGKSEPSRNELLALQKFYNVSTDYLLGFSSYMSSNYDEINCGKDIGLSDSAMGVLRNIREHNMTNNMINKFLCIDNQSLFEAILLSINEIVELSRIPHFKTDNGEKINEAKKRYKKRTGKDALILDDKSDNEFITVDLNNLTNSQNSKMEKIRKLKFDINDYLNKIIVNIVNKNI